MAIKKRYGTQSTGYGRIGCSMELYNDVAEIADKCGLTLTSVVNALLGYALQNSEIVTETKTVEVNTFHIGESVFSEEIAHDNN